VKRACAVRWSQTAESDLKGIVEHIAEESPARAHQVFDDIKARVLSLHTFPDRGHTVPELHDQGITQYRELIIAPWRIIYRISEETVYVLSVLDSRQNVEDILLKRLLGPKP
jgi:plasmid stabilization system protein ParE